MNAAFLFVYGTLRQGAGSGMHRWLARRAQYVASATFPGRLYRLDGYPGAVPSDAPGALVHGEVYRLCDPDPVLAHLDRYEECGPGAPEPTEFVRRMCDVWLHDSATVPAWIYLYNRRTDNLQPIPSGDFVERS